MTLRKLMHDNPALVTAVTIGILVTALAVIGYQVWSRNAPAGPPANQDAGGGENRAVTTSGTCPTA